MFAHRINRAKIVLARLEDLREDVEGDCRALEALISIYEAAEDELSKARAAKRVDALQQSILECLAAFANGRGRA